jgi:hypothetical protein
VVQARIHQALVLTAGMPISNVAMAALAAEEALIESTRGFDVATYNERLRAHDLGGTLRETDSSTRTFNAAFW